MAVDYGITKCKLKSCRKKIIRKYHNPNKKFCKRICYTKWMRGRKAKKYQKRKQNLKEKKSRRAHARLLSKDQIRHWKFLFVFMAAIARSSRHCCLSCRSLLSDSRC